jgi:acetyl esterase
MSPKRSGRSCIQRARKKLRSATNDLIGEGLFGGLARIGRLHPLSNPARHGIRVTRDVEYLPTGNPRHRLDIYRPAVQSGPLPVVVYMHGGAFHLLSKNTHWLMGLAFARAGYLAFNIDYRLAPQNPYPAAVSDICSALEWISEHAQSYGGDLSRLVFAGESAGGNLATALTICCCYRRPEEFAQRAFATGLVPTAVIPACAPLQVSNPGRLSRKRKLPRWVHDILEGMNDAYIGQLHDPAPGELDLADPLHVFERKERPDRALPAFFVPIGTRDPLLDDTRRLDRALKAMNVECEARYYEGELHAFHALVWRRQAQRCWREQLAFLARALQHPREPRQEFVIQA